MISSVFIPGQHKSNLYQYSTYKIRNSFEIVINFSINNVYTIYKMIEQAIVTSRPQRHDERDIIAIDV